MSKKVFQACSLAVLLLSGTILFAQNKDAAPKTSVSMPTMPSVSMPSVGSGFYSPGRSDFYNPNLNRSRQNTAKSTDSQTSTQDSSAGTNTTSSQSSSALANAQKLNTIAKSAGSSLNQLTADDLSSMNNLGMLGSLSSLLGKNPSSVSTNAITANTVDSATLQQILTELTDLKNKISNGTNLSDKSSGEASFSNIVKREPKILRFNVNGYDVLATCKKIYFSEEETDGTFLLTGDRKYMTENKARSETFYFYFHAKGNENGITKYTVTPAVSQDYENPYSYLYQLTQKSTLTADRTGNLVTLRVAEGKWKMDLLISLDK